MLGTQLHYQFLNHLKLINKSLKKKKKKYAEKYYQNHFFDQVSYQVIFGKQYWRIGIFIDWLILLYLLFIDAIIRVINCSS